jgi:hypothetical protein
MVLVEFLTIFLKQKFLQTFKQENSSIFTYIYMCCKLFNLFSLQLFDWECECIVNSIIFQEWSSCPPVPRCLTAGHLQTSRTAGVTLNAGANPSPGTIPPVGGRPLPCASPPTDIVDLLAPARLLAPFRVLASVRLSETTAKLERRLTYSQLVRNIFLLSILWKLI